MMVISPIDHAGSGPVKVALIGFGWFAELLVDRVLSRLQQITVVGAVDQSLDRRARATELGLPSASSLTELLAMVDVEAVAILTPHDTHRSLTLEAAASGLHVFCEKAFAVTSSDCIAMMEACDGAAVVLAVGHMQKLFPTHHRTVEIARSGQYGRVAAIQVDGFHWCPVLPGWWRTTKSCGGLLYWTGIHDIDTMRAVAGCDAEVVYAVAGPKIDDYTDHEDVVAVTITFENGVIGTIQVAEQHPIDVFEDSFNFAVLLEAGGIRMSPGTATLVHAGRAGHDKLDLVTESFGSFESMEEVAYSEELTRFADAVRGVRKADDSALDGLRCIETLEAIYRSVRSGQPEKVVRHPVQAGAQ
jgi:predicted dehydrogenase